MSNNGGNNPWVTIAVAAIGAVGAIGAAVVVRGNDNDPPARTEMAQVQPLVGGYAVTPTPATAPPVAPVGQPAVAQPTVAQPAVAQPAVATGGATVRSEYEGEVLRSLSAQHQPLADQGFTPERGTGEWVGTLRVGQVQDWPVSLASGVERYFVAACDRDCRDIDLEVLDANGARLGADALNDDFPRVHLDATAPGAVTVRVSMHQCANEPCFAAMRIMRKS